MILAHPIATPEIDQPLLAYAGETEAVLAALAMIGYRGIEPFVLDPNRFDADAFLRAARNAGLQTLAVGTGPLAAIEALTFTDPDPAVRKAAIERTKAVIDFAAELGAQVNIGKLRGPTRSHPEAPALRDDAFRDVCAYAAGKETLITLEPQSKSVIDNLNGAIESLAWLDRMALPNLRIMLDTYHMANEDPDPAESIRKAGDRLIHMHFSDSDRKAPGAGHIAFEPTLEALADIEYRGGITLEIAQEPDSQSAALTAFRSTRALIEAQQSASRSK